MRSMNQAVKLGMEEKRLEPAPLRTTTLNLNKWLRENKSVTIPMEWYNKPTSIFIDWSNIFVG